MHAPVGALNISNIHCYIGRGLSAITAIHNISDYKYLYYNLLHQKEYIQSLGVGLTFKVISAKDIQSLPIFLPSIKEQRHIATTLNKANELIALR